MVTSWITKEIKLHSIFDKGLATSLWLFLFLITIFKKRDGFQNKKK